MRLIFIKLLIFYLILIEFFVIFEFIYKLIYQNNNNYFSHFCGHILIFSKCKNKCYNLFLSLWYFYLV